MRWMPLAKVVAIIPAAGQGKRMGTSVSKSYLEILGRPLLAYTLDKFQSHSLIEEIIIVAQARDIEYCRSEIVEKYGFDKVKKIVAGGQERQDSVNLGLAALDLEADWVLIHDGARPLVDGTTISQAIQAAFSKAAAVVGVPVKDTIKVVDAGHTVRQTLDRQTLWAVQTPQVFRRDILEEAYRQAGLLGWTSTDDASLVERLGVQVQMVRGSYKNIKITTPEDLLYLAESLKENEG